MPNVDNPNGLVPYKEVRRINYYNKDASANALWANHPVIMESDGNVAPATSGTNKILGVAAAYSASATAEMVPVYDDPEQLFIVQSDGSNAQTAIGNNASLLITAGSTTKPYSKVELDASSVATTNNLVKILERLLPAERNAFGSWVRLVVKINKHELATGTGQVGT